MSPRSRTVAFAGLLALGGWLALQPSPAPVQTPAPVPAKPAPKVDPKPAPAPAPAPKPKPKPWGPHLEAGQASPVWQPAKQPVLGEIKAGGHVSPAGTEAQVDFPPELWLRNIGGSDGAGMCVLTSVEHALLYQNRLEYKGIRNWGATYPGGGWPARVDQYFTSWAKLKGLPPAQYLQYQGSDTALLELALKTGRLAGVTYAGMDGTWYKGPIAHMVNCVHAKGDEWAIMDNNPHADENGSLKYLWMSRAEFVKRWAPKGTGWFVVPLYSAPPLPPLGPKVEALPTPGPVLLDLSKYYAGGVSVQKPVQVPAGDIYTKGVPVGMPLMQWSVGTGGYWLYSGEKKVGAWFDNTQKYHPYHEAAKTFGPASHPPITPPCVTAPTGLYAPGIGDNEVYSLNGFTITKADAFKLLAVNPVGDKAKLVDDSSKPKLTVIGTEAETDMVRQDVESAPELAKLKDKLSVWCCTPDSWSVKDCGFKVDGKPTLYVQLGGVVLHHQDEYRGPAKLAEALTQALRKADPSYDPATDPDLNRPAPAPALPLPGVPGLSGIVTTLTSPENKPAVLALIGVLLFLLFPRSQTPTEAPTKP